jgi:hypothetical protein
MSKTQQRFNQIEAGRWLQQDLCWYEPTPLSSPLHQATMDHYHAHYNNQTYTAFGDALKPQTSGMEYGDVMNLLIDASLEVSAQAVGATAYAGATARLLRTLNKMPRRSRLFVPALDHLAQFMGEV